MLDNHKAKGEADWEIYGQCVREAMALHGNFGMDEHPVRDKLAYEDLMCGYKSEVTIDGK